MSVNFTEIYHMKFFSMFIVSALLVSGWGNDLEDAKKTAEKDHKLILVSFSGSDWCIPCIRMHKEIFESNTFKDYAETDLVLVNADFPRLSKNSLSKDEQKKNEKLADKYNPEGIFPLTLLLNADGKVLKTWAGFQRLSPEEFTAQVKEIANAGSLKN